MKKIFESVKDEFLDVEKIAKEKLNDKALEQIDNLEEEVAEEMGNKESDEE